jgi:hypothetical protein
MPVEKQNILDGREPHTDYILILILPHLLFVQKYKQMTSWKPDSTDCRPLHGIVQLELAN